MGFPLNIPLTGADVLRTTTTKRHPLGTRGVTRDGRVFRYARNGAAALIPGVPIQTAIQDNAELILDSGTTEVKANSSQIKLIVSATAIFSTKNAYADGYIWQYFSTTAQGGGVYGQIRSHTTQTATKNAVIKFDFVDGDALYSASTNLGTTKSKFAIIRNPYDKVIAKPSGVITGSIVGVAVRPVAVSAYFWLQTAGPCPVRTTGIVDTGDVVGVDTGTSARFEGITSTHKTSGAAGLEGRDLRYLSHSLGTMMIVGVAGEYRMCNLKIAP